MRTNRSATVGKGVMVAVITAAFIAASILPATAGRHGAGGDWPDRGMGGGKRHHSSLGIWQNPQLVDALELTQDQISQLREAHFAARAKRLETRAKLETYRLQMDKALSGGSVDEAAVRQLAEQMADVKRDLFLQQVDSRLTAGRILSAAQRDKLNMQPISGRGPGACWGDGSGHRSQGRHHGRRAAADVNG